MSKEQGLVNRLTETAMSLQFKATGLVVVLTLSVTAGVAGYLMQSSEELAREQHDTQMIQMASVLAKAAAVTLQDGDYQALQALADEATKQGPLIYAIFCDTHGRQLVVAEHGNANILQRLGGGAGGQVPVPGQPVFRNGTGKIPVFLDITYPITARADKPKSSPTHTSPSSTKLLGYVRTGMVADGWYRTMASRVDLVVGVGVLAAMAAIPLGFLLIRRIVFPLEILGTAMDRFSRGELDVRSNINRTDEVGRLAIAFDKMADQHQQTHERIVRMNAELEKRVAERTEQLRELASRDPLTSLYNRRHFNETLDQRFSEATRYGGVLSCMMIDLDGFKAVNDGFGHHTGDQLLILAARTITNQLRSADLAARYGGDEFIILMPQTESTDARVLAERITEEFSREVAETLPKVRVTMSLGIASLPSTDIENAEALVRFADHAMYDAKAAGKDRIVTRACVATLS